MKESANEDEVAGPIDIICSAHKWALLGISFGKEDMLQQNVDSLQHTS